MRRFYPILLSLISLSSWSISAQKVGVVMSGGGAKGVAHIGVIKALEENNIPIDYVAGTSMGAIVGALYAMGYSADEMLELILSDDFKAWQTGIVNEKDIFYFTRREDNPQIVSFNFEDIKPSNMAKSLFSGSLINPIQMNIAFLRLFAPANALCEGDFNKLFVPYFCIASDVYNKKALVLRNGDLGDAVRASMSIPLVFKPIKLDSMLVYDGGIFNNYPVPEMKDIFKPDFIIGSVVSSDTKMPTNERDLVEQMEAIIMHKTDYSVAPEDGIQMRFDMSSVGVLEFYKGKSSSLMGYDSTIAIMDQIKARVSRRVSEQEVAERRAKFKSNLPPLVFDNLEIEGAKTADERYQIHQILDQDKSVFTIDEFEKSYFRVLSDQKIEEIRPHAHYNPQTAKYTLHVDVKMKDQFRMGVGGNLSTMSANQIYLSLDFDRIKRYNQTYKAQVQIGNFHTNVQLSAQLFSRTNIPQYFKFLINYSGYKYYDENRLFHDFSIPSFINQDEFFVKTEYGVSTGNHSKFTTNIGYGNLTDRYYQGRNIDYSKTGFDRSIHKLWSLKMRYEYNTLSPRLYPTSGSRHFVLLQGNVGSESYHPDPEQTLPAPASSKNYIWPELKIHNEVYHPFSTKFTFGAEVEAVYSFKELYSNYTATMLQAPAYTPTVHSKIIFNEAFRANQYVALGVKPIFTLNSNLQLRAEAYAFSPIRSINTTVNNSAVYCNGLNEVNVMGQISAVYQIPIMSISALASYYSYPGNNFYFGISLGYLIFNNRFFD